MQSKCAGTSIAYRTFAATLGWTAKAFDVAWHEDEALLGQLDGGAITSLRLIVPYLASAVLKPMTVPGTPMASQLLVLRPLITRPFSFWYTPADAASGAFSRKFRTPFCHSRAGSA